MRILQFTSLGILTLLLGCSQKTNLSLSQNDIHEITSVISQRTTNHIMGFSVRSNGDVTVSMEGSDDFLLQHSRTGWAIATVVRSEMTDSGLTKSDIHEINSVVSQQTTSHIMGFTVATNGDVTVMTEKPEHFLLHRSAAGWAIVTNAVQEVPQAWGR